MVTVSNLVKKFVDEQPMIQEAMARGFISHGAFAEELKPRIEAELRKEVKLPAIVMALRRYSEELSSHNLSEFDFSSTEVSLKNNISDINVLNSPQLFRKLEKIYKRIGRNAILNIVHGNREVSIITDNKHKDKLLELLSEEKIVQVEDDLTIMSLIFSEEFFSTPGIIFAVTRKLAWYGINIYEIVSTKTELSVVIKTSDSVKAFRVIQELIRGK